MNVAKMGAVFAAVLLLASAYFLVHRKGKAVTKPAASELGATGKTSSPNTPSPVAAKAQAITTPSLAAVNAADALASRTFLIARDDISTVPLWGVNLPAPPPGEYGYSLFVDDTQVNDTSNTRAMRYSLRRYDDGWVGWRLTIPLIANNTASHVRHLRSGELCFTHQGVLQRAALHVAAFHDGIWGMEDFRPLNKAAQENYKQILTNPKFSTVRGIVLEAGGAPVMNARVLAIQENKQKSPLQVARCGNNGEFFLERLPCGPVTLYARADAHEISQKITVNVLPGGKTAPVQIALKKSILLMGTVKDESGVPVANASILALNTDYTRYSVPPSSVTTDQNGQYVQGNLTPGIYNLNVFHPDFVPVRKDRVVLSTASLAVHADFVLLGGVTLTGKVVQKCGKEDRGVADVRITLYGKKSHLMSEEAISKPDGSFTMLHVPVGEPLQVMANNYLNNIKDAPEVYCEKGKPPKPLLLRMDDASNITGRVVDGSGKAVPGAQVKVSGMTYPGGGRSSVDNQSEKSMSSETNAEGRFTLENLPLTHDYFLVATKNGFAPKTTPPVQPDGEVEIVLGQGGAVSGRVVEASSRKPVAGIKLQIYSNGYTTNENKVVTTNEKGGFLFEGVGEGSHSFMIKNTGEDGSLATILEPGTEPPKEYSIKSSPSIKIAEEERRDGVEIEVFAMTSVRGKVLSQIGRQPIAEARVWLESANSRGGGYGEVQSNSEGAFELKAPRTGSWAVCANKQGFWSRMEDPDSADESSKPGAAPNPPGARKTITVQEGTPVEGVELILSAGGKIKGMVVNTDGKPVSPGYVILEARANETRSHRMSPYSGNMNTALDAEGKFEITGVPLDSQEVRAVLVNAASPAPKSEYVKLSTDNPEAQVTIRLGKTGSISGKILGKDGKPASGKRAIARHESKPEDGGTNYTTRDASSDEEGRYKIESLGEGTFSVFVVINNDWSNESAKKTGVLVKAGEDTPNIDFTLDEQTGKTVRGRLADLNSKALAGWQINVQRTTQDSNKQVYKNTQTRADGSFELTGLIDGQYKANISKFDSDYSGQFITGEFDLSEEEMVIVVPTGGVIKGRVVEESTAKPVPYAQISFSYTTPSPRSTPSGTDCVVQYCGSGSGTRTRQDGTFQLDNIPVGEYTLRAAADKYTSRENIKVTVDVTTLQGNAGDIPLQSGFTAKGRLVNASTGMALEIDPNRGGGLSVSAKVSDGTERSIPAEGPLGNGEFRVKGIPLDTTVLKINMSRFLPLELNVSGRGSAGAEVDLGDVALKTGCTVRVILSGPNGEKARECNVNINTSTTGWNEQTNSKGEAFFSGFVAGNATLSASGYSYANSWIPRDKSANIQNYKFTIQEGQENVVRISFPPFPTAPDKK